MRILIPILGFASQGGYRVLSELANAWTSAGHECTFLVPDTSEEPYFPTSAKVLRCDEHGKLSKSKSTKKARGLSNILSLWRALNKIGRDYDVILANHSLTTWPVRWSRTAAAKKFYYIQAYEPAYYSMWSDPIKHIMARLSYSFNLRQITNSSAYKDKWLRPIDLIPPGVDLSIFISKDKPGSFGKDTKIALGTIGRTEIWKGTSTALAAYRLLKGESLNISMQVGFGNVVEADDIAIVAIHGDNELAAYYRSIDILIASCTGQYGAPHYPVIEAMASGTLVVHTGYYPGTEDNSWEATDTSVASVARSIQDAIAASEEERSSRAGAARKFVVANLGWDAIAERFLVHFDS